MILRKNSKVFALPVVVIILLFMLSGCSSDSADSLSTARYDVNFRVVDKASTEVIEGADVNLAGERKITDDNGTASFKKVNGSYDYQVKKTGYLDQNGEIVIKGENTFKDLELEIIIPSDDVDGEEDGVDDVDEDDTIPAEDKTPPFFQNLYPVVREMIYDNDLIAIIEELDQNGEFVILKFSEPVECEDFDNGSDFEVQLSDSDSEEIINIIEITPVVDYKEFIVIEIETIAENWQHIKVTINESGRQKITDQAGNPLSETPEFLEAPISLSET